MLQDDTDHDEGPEDDEDDVNDEKEKVKEPEEDSLKDDSLKDDFEAGEENALVAGLAVPDDFNAGLQEKDRTGEENAPVDGLAVPDTKLQENDRVGSVADKKIVVHQELWDKVHQKGRDKAEAADASVSAKKIIMRYDDWQILFDQKKHPSTTFKTVQLRVFGRWTNY